MVLFKPTFVFLCLLAVIRVGFSGVPYFSNYPFSHHKHKEAQEADRIKLQIERMEQDRTHETDTMNFHSHKKRDLIEEIERIEIQKQIEQERSIPSDLEISHLEIKDHPYQEPTLPNQTFESEELFRLKRDLIAIGSDEEPEPQNSTQITIVPTIEQIPAPEDSKDQPTELPGHKNKVHEKKLKSESSSEEQEKDKKEGRRIRNMPPKQREDEPRSLPAQNPDDVHLSRVKRYLHVKFY